MGLALRAGKFGADWSPAAKTQSVQVCVEPLFNQMLGEEDTQECFLSPEWSWHPAHIDQVIRSKKRIWLTERYMVRQPCVRDVQMRPGVGSPVLELFADTDTH